MKELIDKIIELDTIPFWGLFLFLQILWVVLTSIVFGDGIVSVILNGIGGGLYGWFIIAPRWVK